MTRSELIMKVYEELEGYTRKQTEIIVETFFDAIKSALMKGEKVELRGFGNFKVKTRKPRQARNPKTGEQVEVPPRRVIHFKPGRELKEALNSKEV
ncbi:MAG TPA: integration host factor subunit beta [Nitrospirae bacterium]|nr:integration host factor subunit beta [Nitrospirota bacterium]